MHRVQGNYIKVLLALLVAIAPVSLLTCQSSPAKADPKNSLLSQVNSSDKLTQLKTAASNLKTSLQDFKTAIAKAVKENKLQNTNSQDAIEKITAFNRAKEEFFKLPTSNGDIAKQIEERITNISKVIEPLKEGLENKGKVEEVQKYLESYSKETGKFKAGYGKFGSLTQAAIDEFVTKEIEEIDKLTNQIEPPKAENISSNQGGSSQSDPKNTESESQNKSSNWLPIFIAALFGAGLGSLASIFAIRFFGKRSRVSTQETIPKIQNPKATESTNIQYLQTVINNLTAKVNTDSGRIQNLENQIVRLQNDVITFSQSESNSVASPDWYQTSTPATYQNQTLPAYDSPEAYSAASYEIRTSPTPQLVDLYNHNPRSLSAKAIEVGETEDSINNRRLSGDRLVVLENKRGGSYWIIKEDSIDYMLPKQNLKINEYNHLTVEVLFECRNYYSNYSDYKLVKPAIVQMVSGGTWRLQERGVLEFY